jgi:hypothetical protein
MVDPMRRAMICFATVLAASAGPVAAAARAATSASTSTTPTRAEIARAVAHAERSSYLWATINICLPNARQGGLLGVRGEMGALGFGSTLSMTIQLNQFDRRTESFVPVQGSTATRTETLGPLSTGVHQGGAEFHYSSDTGLLDATVTFTWTRDGHRLGEVTRTTTSGHRTAAFAEPVGHSTASCRL